MKKTVFCLACVLAIETACAAPNFPSGSFTIAGSAKNWKNELFDSTSEITVQAVNMSGTILAEGRVHDAKSDLGMNFAIVVPLSTTATDKTAAVGDELRIFAVENSLISISAQSVYVLESGGFTNLNLKVAEMVYFDSTSKYAADGKVAVAKAYVDGLEPWLEAYGKNEFEADTDWDNDGSSNYEEYLAGTNPFDPSDRLRITAISVPDEKPLLSFEYVGGHVYGIMATPTLSTPDWLKEKTVSYPGADDDGGIATVEMLPVTKEKSRFYTVKPE